MSRARAVLVVGLFASWIGSVGPAQAQTTRCVPIFTDPKDGMRCETQGGAGAPPAASFSWKDVQSAPCTPNEEKRAPAGNYCDARQIAAARRAVGEMINAGQCQDAFKAALSTGDVEYARAVRDLCPAK